MSIVPAPSSGHGQSPIPRYNRPVIAEFQGEAISWRGPAPFVFIPIPEDISADIKSIANRVTYGWGVIPVNVIIGNTEFYTAIIPKEGRYLVPIKLVVQKAEKVEVGDTVTVRVEVMMGH